MSYPFDLLILWSVSTVEQKGNHALFPSLGVGGGTRSLDSKHGGPGHTVLSCGLWGRHLTFLGLSFPICNSSGLG